MVYTPRNHTMEGENVITLSPANISIFRGKYEICNPNKSVSASDLYQDLKYEKFPECLNPCTEMKVATHFKYKSELNQKKQWVRIIFPTDVEFSEETVTKSLFSTSKIIRYSRYRLSYIGLKNFFVLVAEIGGFLGMILGISLLDLEVPMKLLLEKMKGLKRESKCH